MLKSTPSHYGAIPVTIHWLTALLILIAIITGFRAGGSIDPAAKVALLRVHIPTAIAIFLLTIGRIVWWLFLDRRPLPVQDHRLGKYGRPVPSIYYFMSSSSAWSPAVSE
jgi:cytochrome b561